MVVNFKERLGFRGKEPGILVMEVGIDMAYGVGILDWVKTKFLRCASKNRGHHILLDKLKTVINM